MSYQEIPYTWGSKSLAWINAKTDAELHDTVWNTDWKIMEIWDGDMWVNDQAVKRLSRGNNSDNISIGNGVQVDTSGLVYLSTSSGSQYYCGVVIRGNAVGNAQSYLLVAFMGVYPVKLNQAPTIGNVIQLDLNGEFTDTNLPSTGGCGIVTVSAGSAGLVNCVLQTVELV